MSHAIIVAPEARAQLAALYEEAVKGAHSAGVSPGVWGHEPEFADYWCVGAASNELRIMSPNHVTIAYVVEPAAVLVVGVFYGGQDFEAILREDPGTPSQA